MQFIENGNTIRIDPEQFDFEIGSEPFSVEVEDDTYNLYFTKDNTESREAGKEDHDDNLMENYLSMSLNEEEKNPFTGECQGNIYTYIRMLVYLFDFTKIILFDLWLLNESRFSKYYFCIFIIKIGYSAYLNKIGT